MKLLLLVIIILSSTSAWSYRLNTVAQKGARWKQLPIHMEINPENSGLSGAETVAALEAAMNTWGSALGYDVIKTENANSSIPASKVTKKDGKNTIGFSNNFYLDSNGFDSELVVAIGGQYGNSQEMSDAFVLFNSEMVAWDTDNEASSTRGTYRDDLETVALHEFGHVLGLGHSENYNAVMSAQRNELIKRKLHQDDIDGAKFLTNVSVQGSSAFSETGGCGHISNINSNSSFGNLLTALLMMLLPIAGLLVFKRKISKLNINR